jgi:hypothetical protein
VVPIFMLMVLTVTVAKESLLTFPPLHPHHKLVLTPHERSKASKR